MGLNPSIKQMLESQFPQLFKASLPKSSHVVFEDALTRLKFMKGQQPMMSVNEVIEAVIGGDVRQQIVNNPNIEVYILCLDDDSNKPFKGKEMLKRRMAEIARAKKEGREHDFPDGSWISMQGITLPDGTVLSRFDVNRLFNTRYLRMRLWRLVLEEMKKTIWPKGKTIVFEFSKDGPWVFKEDKCVHRTDLAHNHGEADLSVLFWIREFPGRSFVVKTIDSDFIALSNIYLSSYKDSHLEPEELLWVCTQRLKAGTNVQIIDAKALHREILKRFDLSTHELLIGLILCETDFFKKKDTTHSIGPAFILNAIGHLKHYLRSQLQWKLFDMTEPEAEQVLTLFLRVVYSLKFDAKRVEWTPVIQTKEIEEKKFDQRFGSKDRVRQSAAAAEPPLQFPTDELIKANAVDLRFNFNYWARSWLEKDSHSLQEQETSSDTESKKRKQEQADSKEGHKKAKVEE